MASYQEAAPRFCTIHNSVDKVHPTLIYSRQGEAKLIYLAHG